MSWRRTLGAEGLMASVVATSPWSARSARASRPATWACRGRSHERGEAAGAAVSIAFEEPPRGGAAAESGAARKSYRCPRTRRRSRRAAAKPGTPQARSSRWGSLRGAAGVWPPLPSGAIFVTSATKPTVARRLKSYPAGCGTDREDSFVGSVACAAVEGTSRGPLVAPAAAPG